MIDIALKALTPVIEHIFPNKTEQEAAKLKLIEMHTAKDVRLAEFQRDVLREEIRGESWLQRNWRPVTMLTFTFLIVLHWLGFTAKNLDEQQVISLLEIVKVGLGGYVIGRSAEKVAAKLSKH